MKKINISVILLMIFMMVLLFLGSNVQTEDISFHINHSDYLTEGWTNAETKDPIKADSIKLESGQILTMEHVLPEDLNEGEVFGVYNNNMHITAWVENDEIYDAVKDPGNIFGKEVGHIWNIMKLPSDAAGKMLVLRFENLGYENSLQLDNFVIGRSADVYHCIIEKNTNGFVVGVFILIFSVLMFGYYVVLKYSKSTITNQPFLYLGLLSLVSEMWIFLDGEGMQLIAGNASLRFQGSYFTFFMIPIFAALFFREFTEHYKKVLELCTGIYTATVFLVLVFYFSGVVHPSQSILLIHLEIIVLVILLLFVTIGESVKYKDKEMIAPMLAFLALALASMTNLLTFYTSSQYDNSRAFRVGLLLFLMILSVTTIRRSVEEYHRQTVMRLAKQELQLAQAKNDFLAKMSHDMRTPLNGIIGLTTLAGEREDNPAETRKDIEQMHESATYLLSIINDILDMSKIESGKMQLAIAPFRLHRTIELTGNLLRQQITEKRIVYTVDYEDTLSEVYLGDKLRISQIIMNLLSNAVKFTPQNGKITLKVDKLEQHGNKDTVGIQVIDSGTGMSREFMDRMFLPFEQENEFVAENQGGTGLGLSIVRNLILLMDGTIQVKSTLGSGSQFMIEIPLERSARIFEEKQQEDGSCYEQLKGMRVLLVDDHPLNRQIAVRLLKKIHMQVEMAENGREAVEKFEQSESDYYQAILMDIRMPVMDGYEATRIIRKSSHERAKSIRIIAMTANAYGDDVERCMDVGMDEHLAKPIEPEALYQTLYRLIIK